MLNIRVSRREFLKAVQIVENAVFDNKIREVLSGVYIVASGDRIYLRGTDLELSINSEIKGEVRSEGKIVIKHKIIEEFLKQINDEFGTNLSLKDIRDHELDFPPLPEEEIFNYKTKWKR